MSSVWVIDLKMEVMIKCQKVTNMRNGCEEPDVRRRMETDEAGPVAGYEV